MDRSAIFKALRSPLILAIIGGTVLVFLIWFFAVFLHQGSKVNKLNAQAASLQQEQMALQRRLDYLRTLNDSNLESLHHQYSSLMPQAPDTSQYLKQINALVSQSGGTFGTITLDQPTPPTSAAAAAAAAPKGASRSTAYTINVSLSVTATYDQVLRLMQLIYQSPRLTTITGVNITGGGSGTTRGSPLSAVYTMVIYELPGGAGATTTTTTVP